MPRQYPIPKYRQHRATGQAIVVLAGKMHYLGPYGTRASRHEYDRLVCEWLARDRQPAETIVSTHGLLVVQVLRAYWRHAKSYYRKDGRPTGELHPLLQAIKLTRALFGRLPCAEFGPLKLQAVRQAMIQRGWTRKVINRQIGRVDE